MLLFILVLCFAFSLSLFAFLSAVDFQQEPLPSSLDTDVAVGEKKEGRRRKEARKKREKIEEEGKKEGRRNGHK